MLRSFGSCRVLALFSTVLVLAACSGDDSSSSSDGGGGSGSATSATGPTSSGTTSGTGSGTSTSSDTSSGGDGGASSSAQSGAGGGDLGPERVLLGAAGSFVILAKSAVANAPTSAITGDVGLSPAAASYITGLSMTRVGSHWTSAQVSGSIFAADNDPPTPIDLTTAVGDLELAYTDAAGRSNPDFLDLNDGEIGGLTLSPGLYTWSSTVTIPENLTLEGAADDVWIFQISGDLAMEAAMEMILAGGAQAANVFWQVAGTVDFGAGSHAEGIVMALTDITLETGASLDGRLFSQTAVNVAGAAVTAP